MTFPFSLLILGHSLLPVFKDEVSPEQQESRQSLVQVKLEPLQIKDEQQISPILVQVKLETPQVKEEQVEELLVRHDSHAVDDCGASQPRDDQLLSSHGSESDTEDSDDWTSPCPESDIEDSDWEETGEGHSALNKLTLHKKQNVEGRRVSLSNKPSQNLKSSKESPSMRRYLKQHLKTDTGK